MEFNGLSPAEAERLYILSEECSEVVKAVAKICRHGYNSMDPSNPHHISNRDDLEKEISDVVLAFTRLELSGDIDSKNIDKYIKEKTLKEQHIHHQNDIHKLDEEITDELKKFAKSLNMTV